ncbi:uncharacterized protein LY89DRAFT_609882 [Mollisia scopiformis]|uniref:Rhodopsin domain-containing protein n=1 Tax=Mollisia scopiformis TaxID=149040 RepID=A0A194XML1_MOLSC|nr:uncharacterized protein LY89DRAFT_609882 [Mollisia scopiformis]KUJ21329.1 hypothetical protein LY89DRAFT_609882 [Mollisia scopiformis]
MSADNPASIIAVGAVMPALGIIAVGLRYYCRIQLKSGFRTDDWILIPALLLTIGMGASLIAGVKLHALGYPTPFTGDPNDPLAALTQTNSGIRITSQVEWALQLMQVLELGCIKLSFAFFYRRIFVSPASKYFNVITWATIALILAWMTAFFFSLLLACKAYSGEWSAWWGSVIDLTTKCVKTEKLETALVVTDFLTDVLIMLLPIPKIWALHLPFARKLAVFAVFALGIVAVAASVVRMKYFLDVIAKGFNPHDDEDLAITRNLYWSMVESGLGLLAVCLPTLRSLLRGTTPEWLKSSEWISNIRSKLSLSSGSKSNSSKTTLPTTEREGPYRFMDGVSADSLKQERFVLKDVVTTVKATRSDRTSHGSDGDEQVLFTSHA